MAYRLGIISVFLMIVAATDSAKILGIFPVPSKSHLISITPLLTELSNRGHELTVISSFSQEPPLKNIIIEADKDFQVLTGLQKEMTILKLIEMIFTLSNTICENILKQPQIQDLIASEDLHFDLIILESVMTQCLFGFVHKFQAPFIQYFPNALDPMVGDSVGNVYGLSYIPSLFLNIAGKMTFTDRLFNSIISLSLILYNDLYVIPTQDAIMRKYFKDPSLPPVTDLMQNTSLLILNSHFSQHHPRPFTPNTIEAGGMHVKPAKKLPQDLQKFLDEASDGVIYFSMGSNVRSSTMSEEMRQAFLTAFGNLKQKILWKWETDSLPGQPADVKLGKWLPQNDILAHPNVRVFITHGGLMSSQEAIHHAVPMLAIPVFGDQRTNAINAQNKGYALVLEISNITVDSLSWGLNEVLNNPRYRDNVKRMSTLLRDQPQPPLERAVYWTEYVLRHKGARHLRSAALDLSWYQYLLLDVLAVLAGCALVALLVLYLSGRAVYRLLVSKKTTARKRAKKMD